MEMKGKVIVVTGGGSGIGAALVRRFAREGAAGLVVADLDGARAEAVAAEVGGLAVRTDVSQETEVQALIDRATAQFGRVDVLCSNAGIALGGGPAAPDDDWQRSWDVNVMAHVWGARAVLPQMLARGEGYLLQTASAAGLLSHPESATCSGVTAASSRKLLRAPSAPSSIGVRTPCGHRQLTRMPWSPWFIASHSAKATAACLLTA